MHHEHTQNITEEGREILSTKSDPFLVRESTIPLVLNPENVFIETEHVTSLAQTLRERMKQKELLTQNQFSSIHSSPQLVFLLDTVNFCFWAKKDETKWAIEHPQGTVTDGWYGLTACFDRAIAEGVPILNSSYLETLSQADGKHIFRGAQQTHIPLLDERIEFLRESGKVLNTHFGGNAENLLREAKNDAIPLIQTVLKYFPSFRDFSESNDRKIAFLKRAQIVAYDFSLLPNTPIANLDQLTIFADYKLPQLLRSFEILRYTDDLSEKIDSFTILERNSREELEIRAATIWACELLAKALGVSPVVVDNILWYFANESGNEMKPYHRVLTTNY